MIDSFREELPCKTDESAPRVFKDLKAVLVSFRSNWDIFH